MKPASFSYEAPATLAAALAALATRRDEAKIIAGGQSLVPMMNMRLARPSHLVDIGGLAELSEVRREADHLVVGALVRHADLALNPLVCEHAPMLAHAAGTIGHYAIRQRGTLGGSLAHADPAAQLPLCAVALDATVEIASVRGNRPVAAPDFFVSVFTTGLEPDELLVALRLPLPSPRTGWGFRLFTRRAGDFALGSVAATLVRNGDGSLGRLNLAVGGISATPIRLEAVAPSGLIDDRDPEWSARAAHVVAKAAPVEETERVPAIFRRELLAALVRDVLDDAAGRAS
jgi:carbon-monoxide dehydrogenase medium subunit